MVAASFGDSVQQAWSSFFGWLPNLIGAVLIVLIGWLIARLVGGLVRKGLRALGTDRAVETSMVGDYKRRAAPNMHVSDLVATIAFWFVFGLALLLALSALKIPLLGAFVGSIVGYLPSVIAAILILVVGFAIAGAVGALTNRLAGDTMLGKVVQAVVPIVIVAIAIAMALVQLQIAPEIVIATYVIILGAAGLGLALAFGLGGREVAARVLETGYQGAQAKMPQMKEEAQTVSERTQEAAAQAKEKVQDGLEKPAAGPGPGEESTATIALPEAEVGRARSPREA
jgi:hypothetical protein